MPNQAQVSDALRGIKFCCSVDIVRGYWQFPAAAEHRHETVFVSPEGGFSEFTRNLPTAHERAIPADPLPYQPHVPGQYSYI